MGITKQVDRSVKRGDSAGNAVLAGILTLVDTTEVDFVGIGDSNQILQGRGFDHGFQYALSQSYSMRATGLITNNENKQSGSGQGYLYAKNGALGAITGAPVELAAYLDDTLFPANYSFLADGTSTSLFAGNGLTLAANCPIGNGGPIEFDYHYGTFTTGTGYFNPRPRLEESPFSFLGTTNDTIYNNTGAFGMARYTYAIPADATRTSKAIASKWNRVNTTATVGPFFATYMRARNPAKLAGFSYGTLTYFGGHSLRTQAAVMQAASDDALSHYFGILRDDQLSSEKKIVICINSGMNDRNESLTSVGPSLVADGDSAAAFEDNLEAVKLRILAIWTLNGWNAAELYWLVFTSHPISDPDDAELASYRIAAHDWAKTVSNAAAIDVHKAARVSDFTTNSWYANSVSDRMHLTQTGYEQVSRRVLGI